MDHRGHALPLHSGFFAYPREHGGEFNPRTAYPPEQAYSICNLSLSDDQDQDEMRYWTASPKKPDPRVNGKHSPGRKHHELKRSQHPGIDVALRNLNDELRTSLKAFRELVQGFEAEIEPLRAWAEDYTLDTVWRNKVLVCQKRDRERFEGVVTRISSARETVKGAMKNAKGLKETWEDKYKMERQIRTARKAVLYSDGIIGLAERAATERLACKQLVLELEEAVCLLDQKRHPWICEFLNQNPLSRWIARQREVVV
jgi:hypothetical protein